MSEFTGKSIMTQDQMTIGNNTAAHTGSERDHDKILHALRGTIHHFTDRRCIGIIGQIRWQLKFILYQLGQWNNSFPGKIWCIFNSTGIKISIRCTNTNSADSARSTYSLY